MSEECVTDECTNPQTPGDHRKMCITCNPYGDSLVMNNSPEYLNSLRWDEY